MSTSYKNRVLRLISPRSAPAVLPKEEVVLPPSACLPKAGDSVAVVSLKINLLILVDLHRKMNVMLEELESLIGR